MPINPAFLIALIQAGIKEAPDIIAFVKAAKEHIAALFGAGLITAELQNRLHAQVDEITDAFAKGRVPAAWTVEPDPGTPELFAKEMRED
jgi:hypothetical protein